MIELPAEANPLTEANLYNVLRSAASNDPLQIQTGTKQLQRWETERGYYALLQVGTSFIISCLACLKSTLNTNNVTNTLKSIFLDKSLPFEVRYLAIIQLKNGVDKYWRKTGNKYASARLSTSMDCGANIKPGTAPSAKMINHSLDRGCLRAASTKQIRNSHFRMLS